jgi:hypothetical protein
MMMVLKIMEGWIECVSSAVRFLFGIDAPEGWPVTGPAAADGR